MMDMMTDIAKLLLSCVKTELDKGVEGVDTGELGEVIDMIFDLAQAEYYYTVVDEMLHKNKIPHDDEGHTSDSMMKKV